jgi:hypothetical protein
MDPSTTPKPPLNFEYDYHRDVMTIEGVKYAGALFREFGINGMPQGQAFTIESRGLEGVLTIRKLDRTRIRIGPMEIICSHCKEKDTLTLDIENPLHKDASHGRSPGTD